MTMRIYDLHLMLKTNRELMTLFERFSDPNNKNPYGQYMVVQEMTRRLGRRMITDDIVPLFKQYKLNGAGDKYE